MADLMWPWNPIEVRTTIAAPPDVVFDVLLEPRTYPDWLVGTKQMRAVDPAFPAPGTALHHTVGAGPVALDDSTEVVDVGPRRHLELEVHLGPLHGDVELDVYAHPSGSEVRFRERPIGPPAVLTPLLRPLFALRNRRSLQRLRDLVTTDADREASKR